MSVKEEDIVLESILKGLNIPKDRYVYIMSYIQQMAEDYKGKHIDIIKEISFNLKGNERYFAMFIVGKSFSPLFYEMDDIEKTDFVVNIVNNLKFSDERVTIIAEYMTTIKKEMGDNVPIIDIIKMIINSKFRDVEKDYIIFIFGLVLV